MRYLSFSPPYRISLFVVASTIDLLFPTTLYHTAAATTSMASVATIDLTVKGEFVRKPTAFHNKITADGSSGFKAEANRYHLYVCYACPFASRTLAVRKLKGLEKIISLNVVDWFLDEGGWKFNPNRDDVTTADTVNGSERLREVYLKADSCYAGAITVPVLWDKKTGTIVNNESAEIIRIFNCEFNEFCATPEQAALDLYPQPLQAEIDEFNSWIYPTINNGVYRCGFAKSQEPYNVAVHQVFESLDRVEEILSRKRYLCGNQLTEADIRLFVTLVRFDQVYHGHFKCNKKCLREYPNLWGYTRDIYQHRGIGETVNIEHIRNCYMASQLNINPFGIIPIGPDLDFEAPHGRENMK
ncbi:PREDICTED: glutathionyl-hydroquinone reductase YqjG-like isoform X2 [Priapulus caudatus]|uniref:Glutathionyl-hydroquinone reductase YqjG-like isoform X2 n=1 Tax=Priapulus caudatus TaxID=37621 RepID=A0ABM1DSP9_PRICU|nr:PREDICTED: glutathionyl-hydroquinone reductase YqjG-like isoform X2 [Priapulus caudatus]